MMFMASGVDLLALFVSHAVRGMGLIRTIIFIPVVTSLVVGAVLWAMLYNKDLGLIQRRALNCKTSIPGSNPGGASKFPVQIRSLVPQHHKRMSSNRTTMDYKSEVRHTIARSKLRASQVIT